MCEATKTTDPVEALESDFRADAAAQLAAIEREAASGWLQLQEQTTENQGLKAQVAAYQLQVTSLAGQLELAKEAVAEWQSVASQQAKISEQRGTKLSQIGGHVQSLSGTMAEQSQVTTEVLAEVEARWQKSEDQRVAACEQVEALEERLRVASSKADNTERQANFWTKRAERLAKTLHRGMRIMARRLELLEESLTLSELADEAAQNWAETLCKTGTDALEALLGQNCENSPSDQIAMIEHLLFKAFAGSSNERDLAMSTQACWLSAMVRDTEDKLRKYKQTDSEPPSVEVPAPEQADGLRFVRCGAVDCEDGALGPAVACTLVRSHTGVHRGKQPNGADWTWPNDLAERLADTRYLTQAEQCQSCGRDRAMQEGFIRGSDNVWRCLSCAELKAGGVPGPIACAECGNQGQLLNTTDDRHTGGPGRIVCTACAKMLLIEQHVDIDEAEPSPVEPSKVCHACGNRMPVENRCCPVCLHDQPLADPSVADELKQAVEDLRRDMPEDFQPVRLGEGHLPMRPELGPCGMAGCCELPLGHYGDHKAGTSTWTNEMGEEFRRKLLQRELPEGFEPVRLGEGHLGATQCGERWLQEETPGQHVIRCLREKGHTGSHAGRDGSGKHFGWYGQFGALPLESVTFETADDSDRPASTEHPPAERTDQRPEDCTFDQARALRRNRKTRIPDPSRRQRESCRVSASEGCGAEGRTSQVGLPEQLNKPVTCKLSETACQNMANRLDSQLPERLARGWVDRTIDTLSVALGLTRTQDLALRILVKGPKGRE